MDATAGNGAAFPLVERLSPNHGARRGVTAPDMVVLHYTGMDTARAAADRLCDPVHEVSAHYMIDLDGSVLLLVPEEARAWHAGAGSWGAVVDVNSHSVGIEIVNPGHADAHPPFPEPQMATLERLLAGVMDRWAIPPERVVGHSDTAPGRKLDPGRKFDWRRLARSGLAVWLDFRPGDAGPGDARAFRDAARRMGYGLDGAGEGWDAPALAVWEAFATRFLPALAGAPPRADGVAHAERLARRWPVRSAGPDAPDAPDGPDAMGAGA